MKPSVSLCEDGITIRWGNIAVVDVMADGASYAICADGEFRPGSHGLEGPSFASAMREIMAAIDAARAATSPVDQ